MADLLIELFSEEIPARMQAKASDDLKRMMADGLKAAGLTFDAANAYATPRRLTLHMTGLPAATPDVSEERRGPRVDAPEKAIEGFLRGAGVAREDLVEREDKKGTFLYAIIEQKGQHASTVIGDLLSDVIHKFPWQKSQRWGSNESLRWVRPLQSVICLFDGEVVPGSVGYVDPENPTYEGIAYGNTTQGHRFMAPGAFAVTDFVDYQRKLMDAKVRLDPTQRQTLIKDSAQTLASAAGLELVEDAGLIAEVAGLTEWPVPMIGAFDPAFLQVPEEVLILTMRKDQKYFVTRDPATGKLANKFIFTANFEPSDDGSAVTRGNERVLAARLSDAKFFYEQDLKGKLEDNLPALNDIVFHKELGTVAQRVERIKKLSRYLADFIPGCDADEAERAAELCKADLVSGMVYEFPEVQGIMGRYYAKAQGESDAVADAIRDHYAPLGPSDDCPSAPVSVAVALAEKLDTLVGFFGIDQKPTGSKDPYALRRAALGVIRLVTENDLKFELGDVINFIKLRYYAQAFENLDISLLEGLKGGATISYTNQEGVVVIRDRNSNPVVEFEVTEGNFALQKSFVDISNDDLLNFLGDRLKVQQRDKGVRHDLIDAVFAKGGDDLVRILNRVSALSAFLETDDGANLLAGYKRAANILKIEEKKDGKAYDDKSPERPLELEEEKAFWRTLASARVEASNAVQREDFAGAMQALSLLRKPIDDFFEKVMINVDDPEVRLARLGLLGRFRAAVNTVADFSLIEG